MGKTAEFYHIAIEDEIRRWRGFANALRSEEKAAFETLMDACRAHASAGSNVANPTIFEPMAISIMLHQQMRLNKLEKKINDFKQPPKLQP